MYLVRCTISPCELPNELGQGRLIGFALIIPFHSLRLFCTYLSIEVELNSPSGRRLLRLQFACGYILFQENGRRGV